MSSPFNPISPQERDISNLFIGVLIVGAVVFALVAGLVIYAAICYRRRAGDDREPPQVFGWLKLEIVWTAIPVVLLAVIFGFTVSTMRAASPGPNGQQPDLVITGYQWWWGIQYPQAGVATANEIHLPAGKRLLLQIDAADVIHDFWVPQLGRKIDAIPGKTNYLWVEPQTPGTYLGACAEYCGNEHAWMLIRVVVQPQPEYDAWLKAQALPQPAPTGGDAARGAQVFQQLTCASCHAIAGTQAGAAVGPNLTHLGSRETIGAGVLTNTPENLASWLRDPQAVKPGSHMPNLQLSEDDIRALVAYLESQ